MSHQKWLSKASEPPAEALEVLTVHTQHDTAGTATVGALLVHASLMCPVLSAGPVLAAAAAAAAAAAVALLRSSHCLPAAVDRLLAAVASDTVAGVQGAAAVAPHAEAVSQAAAAGVLLACERAVQHRRWGRRREGWRELAAG